MKLGLIGEVLGHSLSPAIHGDYFKTYGYSDTYDLVEIPKDHFEEIFPNVLAAYDGLNVTIPYKEKVIPYLDEISEAAKNIGAVNTIEKRNGKIIGHNTDYIGFQKTLAKIGAQVEGKSVLVLGHGGAARAIVQCLYDEGAKEIWIASRHVETVEEGFARFASERRGTLIPYEEAKSCYLLVNTTPVGMFPKVDASPISAELAKEFPKVIDIIYNPDETKLLREATKADQSNGLTMLHEQAIAAEKIWRGIL